MVRVVPVEAVPSAVPVAWVVLQRASAQTITHSVVRVVPVVRPRGWVSPVVRAVRVAPLWHLLTTARAMAAMVVAVAIRTSATVAWVVRVVRQLVTGPMAVTAAAVAIPWAAATAVPVESAVPQMALTATPTAVPAVTAEPAARAAW